MCMLVCEEDGGGVGDDQFMMTTWILCAGGTGILVSWVGWWGLV